MEQNGNQNFDNGYVNQENMAGTAQKPKKNKWLIILTVISATLAGITGVIQLYQAISGIRNSLQKSSQKSNVREGDVLEEGNDWYFSDNGGFYFQYDKDKTVGWNDGNGILEGLVVYMDKGSESPFVVIQTVEGVSSDPKEYLENECANMVKESMSGLSSNGGKKVVNVETANLDEYKIGEKTFSGVFYLLQYDDTGDDVMGIPVFVRKETAEESGEELLVRIAVFYNSQEELDYADEELGKIVNSLVVLHK